jgi:hydrogenase 3 maturation protease
MLPELEKILSGKYRKILFVGIGNVLKSDDGAGVYICNRIRNRNNISSLSVEVSIENYIGKINSLKPEILILVDCADFDSPPGSCKILEPGMIQDLTFNTHNISLKKISDFFKMPVFVLGIQPENIEFGENISYIVKKVADNIIQMINSQEVQNGC